MIQSRMGALLAALVCALFLAVPADAAQVEAGDVYCFAGADFSDREDLSGICITAVPETGTVLLGSRTLRPGDVLTVDQISQMTYKSLASELDSQAQVTYLPIFPDCVQTRSAMSIAVLGRTDEAPVAEDSALETYRNLPNEALLKVKDPEGQPMTFAVIRSPRRGDVVIRPDGSFIYTPKKNKVGVDSFVYTATDSAGNVSREATVTVTILKPTDARQYTDTAGESCQFAAEWMKHTGIFVGENVNGNGCFQPEKQVSRGDFLTMLVGALEMEVDENATFTGFTDDAPDWLKPYLAAAMRSGLMLGWPDGDEFHPDKAITGAEAAVLIQNALDLAAQTAATGDAHSVLAHYGLELEPEATLTRGQAAEVIYQVAQLKADAPGMDVIRRAN